jgi:hypothetical protein
MICIISHFQYCSNPTMLRDAPGLLLHVGAAFRVRTSTEAS